MEGLHGRPVRRRRGRRSAASTNPRNPQDRQDAWNILFGEISRGYLSLVPIDADHPEFVPTYNTGFNIAAPNPDYVYYGTPLNGQGVYRLRGNKGSNRFTFMQFTGPSTDDPKTAATSMFNFFRLDQVPAAADGSFDFILSAERPAGYTGHWEKMDPRATGIFMRAVSYDWLRERDPVVGIERTDIAPGRARLTAQETATRLKSLVAFVKRDSMVWWKHMADLQAKNMWNRVAVEPWGTFPGQVYLEGLFRIADDEALVLETAVPAKCLYWAFLVGDMQFRTGDYGQQPGEHQRLPGETRPRWQIPHGDRQTRSGRRQLARHRRLRRGRHPGPLEHLQFRAGADSQAGQAGGPQEGPAGRYRDGDAGRARAGNCATAGSGRRCGASGKAFARRTGCGERKMELDRRDLSRMIAGGFFASALGAGLVARLGRVRRCCAGRVSRQGRRRADGLSRAAARCGAPAGQDLAAQ